MTRLELLVAAAVLAGVCLLSCAGSGYQDAVSSGASAAVSPFAVLLPLKSHSFMISAVAVTLLGLLLEDGRRRNLVKDGEPGSADRSRRPR